MRSACTAQFLLLFVFFSLLPRQHNKIKTTAFFLPDPRPPITTLLLHHYESRIVSFTVSISGLIKQALENTWFAFKEFNRAQSF